ncbi:PREDICTED: eukaryotic translation initiation factor 2-alpha kinase 1-like [Dinoponera quadriceps]|uniref:non-specific serine/threonine protein kinase n=1 Tax=Dinoponera quadriceps TaxID=609295 RepID=A0A6P3WUT4_DINQU|nr:PREDICTED: eukaryotic translation initiation factor 2-alpha kinase 1-like [Dinoponera quadriceps]
MENTRDEESADCRRPEDINNSDHPWSTLETITTFDQGNNMMPTLRLNNIRESQDNRQVAQVNSSSSMLIVSIIQHLCALLEKDEASRNKLYYAICDKMHEFELIDNSYNMMEFESMRGQYQRAIYRLITLARSITGSENILHIPNYLPDFSRYLWEFQEINFIAGGGFGQVFKALHRLDGIEYAIKKISVLSSRLKTITSYLKEVKTLAKLNHPNIVQYKAAWIEPSLPSSFVSNMSSVSTETSTSHKSHTLEDAKDSQSENSQSNENSTNNSSSLNLDKAKDSKRQTTFLHGKTANKSAKISKCLLNIKWENKMDDTANGYTANDDTVNKRLSELNSLTNMIGKRITEKSITQECSEDNSYIVSFRNSKSSENKSEASKHSNSANHNDSHQESSNHREMCTFFPTFDVMKTSKYMTLYIQMALYEQTLKEWMCERSNATPLPVVKAVFEQIVAGLDYIHSQGITHHDIKPSNIFITTSGPLQIHLGDFGLACSLHRKNHHSVIGTQMYAAPEQLEGKCDSKSDIYSTGIVLTELLILTQTQMELIHVINSLKHGDIPQDLSTERLKWARLIIQLIKEDPVKRPCANQLLQDLNEEKDATITELKKNLLERDNTIRELQKEIALLKEKCEKLEISPEKI